LRIGILDDSSNLDCNEKEATLREITPSAPPPSHRALAPYFAIAEGIAALMRPFVEAVVHDLASDTVACVANPFSPRAIGDPSDLAPSEFAPGARVIGPYEKVNFDGRLIKSISIILRDDAERPIGMMCINADVTEFDAVRRMLSGFLGAPEPTSAAGEAFRDDWHEKINRFVAAWIAERGTTVDRLDRNGRRELIEALYVIRAFDGRRAPAYVAAILGVSRATVYNEISRLRTEAAA
jgi:D-arginine utilization repressor